MIEFREFGAGRPAHEWDATLHKFSDSTFQQTYSFGEFTKTDRAEVFRAVLTDGSQTVVMAQGLIRKLPFRTAVLVLRGAPVYQASPHEETNLKHLRDFLERLIASMRASYSRFYLNITMTAERCVETELALREAGMERPFFERVPYLTYVVPIHDELDKNLNAFGRKWRNQLRRAESLGVSFRWGNDDRALQAYLALHNRMCRLKSITSYSLTYDSLLTMRHHLQDRLQFLIGDSQGQDVCGCGVVMADSKAYYYYAAANEEGRAGYFSNAMVWHLIRHLRQQNVRELDMSGVDPATNWGGYHFKKGAGGRPYAYVGEWDATSTGALKLVMNVGLWWRSRRMYR